MVLETCVLSGNQRVDDVGGDFGIIGVDTVTGVAVVTAHFLPVGRVDYRGELIVGVLKFFHRRHIAYPSVVDENEKEYDGYESDGENPPYPSDYGLVALAPAFLFRHGSVVVSWVVVVWHCQRLVVN